jgi:molybdate transport system ATP-binding protein
MTLSVEIRHSFPDFMLDVAFQVPLGITGIFGRSGAGKTSIIRAVAGLLRPDAGQIANGAKVLFDRKINLPPHLREIGYVFQEARLFPHMTVRQNLTYGGADQIDRVVDMLGISPLLDRRPLTLSGGEAQRVAIGRALLRAPRLLLMDEPLAALDAPRKAEIMPYLERLRDEVKIPILYVSHSVDELARLATTLVVIEAGRVLCAGPARAIFSDLAASQIFGAQQAGAIMSAQIAAHEADGLTRVNTAAGPLFIPFIGRVGDRLAVRIHAQDVMLARTRPDDISALNILPVSVLALTVEKGPSLTVQLRAGDEVLLARITKRSAVALELDVGSACFAILKSVAVTQKDIATT